MGDREDGRTTLISGNEALERSGAERDWVLIAMSGNCIGQIFPLDVTRPLILIGREEEADVQVLDAEMSRRHAAIRFDANEGLLVMDLESRNGTSVNGVRVEQQMQIEVGDKIKFGTSTIMRLSLSNEPEVAYAARMYQAALRDGLTGAFNRRYFDERLTTEVAFAQRHHDPLALLLLDLDFFKRINDEQGHQLGDYVLTRFVELLVAEVRSEDVVARYGGEEFAVLCRDTADDKAMVLAERLRSTVANTPFEDDGKSVTVTVSIGVANIAEHPKRDAAALVEAADRALYAAKSGGRNRCVLASAE